MTIFQSQRTAINCNDEVSNRPLPLVRLVIVGGGMAGHRLCRRLFELSALARYSLTLIGEEPQVAYDRVNASKLFDGATEASLELSPREWYESVGINLQTERRIVRIDRVNQLVIDSDGVATSYDGLVLSTGSYAWVPKIPGLQDVDSSVLSQGVFVYRTLGDLRSIQHYVLGQSCRRAAVIGGGLLGLEAAKVLRDLGLKPTIIEAAAGLMPRQLAGAAAKLLKQKIEDLGVEVQNTRRTSAVHWDGQQILVEFENAAPIATDLLVVATGVRPRSELARDCGLEVGNRNGIKVNAKMQTSDPQIFAIGECAEFRGHVYGLVAPCYRMAEVLAENIAGTKTVFEGADESAELKLMGVPVVALGEPICESSAGVLLKYSDAQRYRQILLERGRLIGAAAVGDWAQLPLIRYAINKRTWLWPHQRQRFEKTGNIWHDNSAVAVAQWPDDAIVCACRAVTVGNIRRCPYQEFAAVQTATGAATACGSCTSLVHEMLGSEAQHKARTMAGPLLLATSVFALILTGLWWFVPVIPFADSVQENWYRLDQLWRSFVAKQITGYSVLAASAVGLAGYTLKKRTKLLRIGSYAAWRTFHTTVSSFAVGMLVLHTGFRAGSHLNFLLNTIFILLALMGGITGLISAMEASARGANALRVRSLRPWVSRIHICLFSPLPALLIIHIVSVYWY